MVPREYCNYLFRNFGTTSGFKFGDIKFLFLGQFCTDKKVGKNSTELKQFQLYISQGFLRKVMLKLKPENGRAEKCNQKYVPDSRTTKTLR